MQEFINALAFLAEDGEDAEGALRIIGGGLPLVIAVVCVFLYARGTKRKRLIEDTPTSKVKGVFIGLNEIKGTANLIANMRSYLNESACCWYAYRIEEHYTRTETYTDSKGNTRTRTKSGWETVASGSNRVEFDLVDDTGQVRVMPADAEIEGNVIIQTTCTRGDAIYYDKGPAYAVRGSNYRRRFVERAIVQDDALYVLGSARMADDSAKVEIAKEDEIYMITVKSEEQLVSRYGWMVRGGWLGVVAGCAAAPASIGCLLMERNFDDVWLWMIPSGLGGLLLTMLMYVIYVFNGLVSPQVRLARAWSLIDIQLKRRYDLIGNLVEVCKAFLKHERETHQLVINARSGKYTQGEAPSDQQVSSTESATNAQNQVINQLFALREDYPKLKADSQMLQLHKHLVECEDRLAIARTFYNEGAGNYNERIRRVPEVFFARLMGYVIAQYYQVEPAHTRPVDLDAMLNEADKGKAREVVQPPELMGEDEEVVILALVCLMSADGAIDKDEYAAFEKFVADATGNSDIAVARQKAQEALDRVKASGVEAIMKQCVDALKALRGKPIVESFVEALDVIAEANDDGSWDEASMLESFKKAVEGDE